MPYRNGVTYYGAYGGGDNTAPQARNPTTSRQLSESTKYLFNTIDNGYLEGFKQALKEGADVNAFDEEGMTPLMSIARACDVTYGRQPMLEKMAKLLIQNSSIDINAQSREYVYKERQKRDRHGRLVYLSCGREVVQTQSGYHVYLDDGQHVDGENSIRLSEIYGGVMECVKTSKMKKDTALHIACQVGAKDIVKILLTHPDVKTDIINYKYESPKDCIARGFEGVIKLEFKKAQKANELLDALSSGDIYQAKRLLNQELNPNCWKRNQNGEIETPLSLILKSCLQGITQDDNEEVLTKLLKHKDLDFSQIRSIPAIEKNIQLKQIIEQAITERLTDTINRKDLDDVKELVEDNCFINRAIVTAALRDASEPTESVKNYLSEKFPTSAEQPVASTHNVQPVINDEFIAKELQQLENFRDELGRTKTQLTETKQELANKTSKISQLERDLKQVREERDRLSSENRLLRTKSLSNKNEKPLQAISPGRKQSNYASASFVFSGAFAVGACLTIPNLEICIPLAVTAFAFFTIGCYCSYKANTALSNVKSTQLGNVISLERS
ncbi:ankyrin repeat domain-containing protein [Wolbachia endosymbiont (group A) of Pogonocherus hispidulus]|uniref:TomO hydrophobic C-terminal domain-containing protein n=1 Tax=Wolbachia endosymbiont (group A) of Pogonocherus hispidulus TaxID=3066136 RepID=UPI003340E40C